jgi:uncharacterized LabA/DUF88 family protein
MGRAMTMTNPMKLAAVSTLVMIDGANFASALRSVEWRIDWARLRDYFQLARPHVQLRYYTALDMEDDNNQLVKFTDWLSYNGFVVVTKHAKRYTTGSTVKIKGNMDVEIATDMYSQAEHFKHIILFSGDGDFAYLLNHLRNRYGTFFTIVSGPNTVSNELRRSANNNVDITSLQEIFQTLTSN